MSFCRLVPPAGHQHADVQHRMTPLAAFHHFAQDNGLFPGGGKGVQGGLGGVFGHGHAQAHTHVEGVEHIPLGDVARGLNHLEDGQHRHGGLFNLGGEALLEHAGDVLVEAASGDVGDGLDVRGLDGGQHGLDVDAGGG